MHCPTKYQHVLVTATLLVLSQSVVSAAPEPVAAPPLHSETIPAFPVLDRVATADPRFGVAARSDQLDNQRGGTDTVNNNMQLDGSVHGNVANNVVTGSNGIDAGSFANMSGIPTVIQNTGANVLIQNATIINLQLK
jgi:hypothetical protein